MNNENPTAFALSTLANLKPGDPRLVHLTRELNHFSEVLRTQGERHIWNQYDMITLFARMHDIAAIEPINENRATPNQPNEGSRVDLDQIESSLKRAPSIFKMPQKLKEPIP